jgi:hypothetical protein
VELARCPAFGQVTTGSSAITGANGIATPSTTVSAEGSQQPPAPHPAAPLLTVPGIRSAGQLVDLRGE